MSIPGSMTRRTTSLSSRTLPISIPQNSPIFRVNPQDHPDWAGEFKSDDCMRASGLLNGRVAYYDPQKKWIFWSKRWVVKPSQDDWELPFGTTYGGLHPVSSSEKSADLASCGVETCTLLIRMGKDYGKGVLPMGKDYYLDTDGDDPKASIKWVDILQLNPYMLDELQRHGQPAWSSGLGIGGRQVMILYLPKSSTMRKTWAADIRSQRSPLGDILWASNTTTPQAEGTSPVSNELTSS